MPRPRPGSRRGGAAAVDLLHGGGHFLHLAGGAVGGLAALAGHAPGQLAAFRVLAGSGRQLVDARGGFLQGGLLLAALARSPLPSQIRRAAPATAFALERIWPTIAATLRFILMMETTAGRVVARQQMVPSASPSGLPLAIRPLKRIIRWTRSATCRPAAPQQVQRQGHQQAHHGWGGQPARAGVARYGAAPSAARRGWRTA
jgi:hypothetical protein